MRKLTMTEQAVSAKEAMLKIMTVVLGKVAGDKDAVDMYNDLKEGGLIKDTELVSDTVMFNLERIHKSHSELQTTMAGIKTALQAGGELYSSASEKVLGDANRINRLGVDVERFIGKVADYYVDMLSATNMMLKCIQSNIDVMATLEHTVIVNLNAPSIVWDAATDDEDIALVLGSNEGIKQLVSQMLEKVGER